jgi:hypothetical protein
MDDLEKTMDKKSIYSSFDNNRKEWWLARKKTLILRFQRSSASQ